MRNRLGCVVGIVAALLGLAQTAHAALITTMTSTNMGAYTHYVYAFTTDANLSNASGTWTVPAGISSIELLVVAGGGAGGGNSSTYPATNGGGGGGAGGLLYTSSFAVTAGNTYNIQVGGGGVAVQSAVGGNGSNSFFDTQIAIGGGGGGCYASAKGQDGGSGGGGLNMTGYGPGAGYGTQGNSGASSGNSNISGGGGGAGAAATDPNGGIGTNITQFASWGDPAYPGWFAGGGGGFVQYPPQHGTSIGGKGGGGYGAYWTGPERVAASGATGTGGGGGGGRAEFLGQIPGNGGSGIVLLAYDLYTIPEPSTMLLLVCGGAFVWRAAKRR